MTLTTSRTILPKWKTSNGDCWLLKRVASFAWCALSVSILLACDRAKSIRFQTTLDGVIVETVVSPAWRVRNEAFFVYGEVRIFGTEGVLEWADVECLKLYVGKMGSKATFIDSYTDVSVQRADADFEVLAKIYWTFKDPPNFAETPRLEVAPPHLGKCFSLRPFS